MIVSIGNRIREQRKLLGFSQTELAKKVRISKQTLYKYEKNIITNIPSDKIEEIAKILEVSEAYLMGWEEEEKVADNMYQLSVSPKLQKLIDITEDMKPEQLDKVIDYAEFIKSKKEGG